MDTDDQYGLIILGNSGAGKSFLGNILLGHNAFVHEFSPSSVTHTTEYEEMRIGYYTLAIFNIPGLIEATQERIDLNKIEIDKAFTQRPNSIVMFVFSQTGGRIKDEDVVAFNAINAAYPFKPESLVLVVNDLQQDRSAKYEGTTLVLLRQLLNGVPVNNRNLCFLDHINGKNATERQRLKEQLLQVIVEFQPSLHEKKQEIQTLLDQLKKGKKLIKEQQVQFEADRAKYMKQIEDGQRLLNETIANHRSETESLQRAMQVQKELYEEQERRFQKANESYQAQLQDLRGEAERTQNNYEALRLSNEATQQQILAARQENERLKNAYQELVNRSPPPRPPKPRWYETTFEFLTKAIPVVNLIPWSSLTGSSKK